MLERVDTALNAVDEKVAGVERSHSSGLLKVLPPNGLASYGFLPEKPTTVATFTPEWCPAIVDQIRLRNMEVKIPW